MIDGSPVMWTIDSINDGMLTSSSAAAMVSSSSVIGSPACGLRIVLGGVLVIRTSVVARRYRRVDGPGKPGPAGPASPSGRELASPAIGVRLGRRDEGSDPVRRLSVLILACLLIAACGDDTGGEVAGTDDGGAEPDEFCMTLEPLAEIDALSEPTAEEVTLLEEAKAAAPDDLGPAFDELIAATEVFIASDLEAMAEFDEEAQLQASADLVAAAAECGLDVPIFVYGGGEAESGDPGDTAAARERYDSSDLRTALETAYPELDGQHRRDRSGQRRHHGAGGGPGRTGHRVRGLRDDRRLPGGDRLPPGLGDGDRPRWHGLRHPGARRRLRTRRLSRGPAAVAEVR